MQAMDCVESREMADKCEFFAILPQAVPQFPKVRRFRLSVMKPNFSQIIVLLAMQIAVTV